MSRAVARPSLVPPADVQLLPFLEASDSPIAILPFSPDLPASQADATPRSTAATRGVLRPLWGNHAWRSMVGTKRPERTGEMDEAAFWDFLPGQAQEELAELLVDRIGRLDGARVVTLPHLADRAFTATILPDQGCVVLTLLNNTPIPPSLPILTRAGVPAFLEPHMNTEMGKLIATFDWETTPLGPLDSWSGALKTLLAVCLGSTFRTSMSWGPENTILYNNAYIEAARSRHPAILGQPFRVAWADIWDQLKDDIRDAMAGTTCLNEHQHIPFLVNGRWLESYHTYLFMPLRDETGTVQGIFNVSFESTREIVAERRVKTVQQLVQRTALCRTVSDFCGTSLACLEANPYDLPFVQLYTTEVVQAPRHKHGVLIEGSSTRSHVNVTLQGSVGIPAGHAFDIPEARVNIESPGASNFTESDSTSRFSAFEAFAWPFEQVLADRSRVVVQDLSPHAAELPGRAWGDNPFQAVVIPIFTEATALTPSAILVLGLNPRCDFGEAYDAFTQVVAQHVTFGLLAVTGVEADARRAAALVALDKAKSSFFSSTSHELRTPLTLILGPLDDILYRKEILPSEVQQQLMLVNRNANRLLSMVNKLLDYSALEGGQLQVRYHPVHLGAFTAELASLFRDAVERAGILFEVSCDDDPPDAQPVYISRDLYRNVVFNILGNALKYTVSGRIMVRLRTSGAEAVLEVEDTGVGIPAEAQTLIFERFSRVEGASQTANGTGIGLALALETVKALGAELEVASTFGKGTTFFVRFKRGYIHLPKGQISQDPILDAESSAATTRLSRSEIREATSYRYGSYATDYRPAPPSSGGESTTSGSGSTDYFGAIDVLETKNCTVLLAEDNPDLRLYISSLLRKRYRVIEAVDGQAAWEYALASPPDLVLTDVMMLRMGGEELFAALRSNPSTALVPVLFLSAAADPEARTLALERGVDDFLVKPFQSRELQARVRVHLQRGRMHKETELEVAKRTAELHESEAQSRAFAQRYATITNLSPVGIFQLDAVPNIIYTNSRFHEISGHPVDRPLEEWATEVSERDLPELLRMQNDIAKGRLSGSLQFQYRNGTWVQLEFRRVTEFGPSVAYLGTICDITSQKDIEVVKLQAVEQRAADADAHRKQIENFIDITSHELRNPLSGVWQNAQIIGVSLQDTMDVITKMQAGKMPTAESLQTLAEEMKENLDGISSILLCAAHHILNVSRLNSGLLTINRASFNFVKKLEEIVQMFETDCFGRGIKLSLVVKDIVSDIDAVWVVADANRLAQTCVNLLLNGIKYTPTGGSITITLDASPDPPPLRPAAMRVGQTKIEDTSNYESVVWVSVIVEDTGKGLTETEMKTLFERFAQANPRTDQYGDSGLGLFVSKQLVQLHHGFIEVDSVPGEGSTFRFAVPCERGTPNEDAASGRRPSLTNRGVSANSFETKRKIGSFLEPTSTVASPNLISADPAVPIHILVVEDNTINQKVLKRQLVSQKYEVTLAGNGLEALNILQAVNDRPGEIKAIDLILLDIEMPVMGGLDAIRELRAREVTQQIKTRYGVIAVTGNARREQVEEYLAAGFDDVAIKPYSFKRLLVQIEQLTGRREEAPSVE